MQKSSPGSQTISLKEGDSGKTLTISNGGVFTLILFNKVDGGYRFNNEQFNPAVLQLESHSATAATDGRQGSPGRETWQFKTIKKGKTVLRITASRPWLPKDSIAIFSDVIIVK